MYIEDKAMTQDDLKIIADFLTRSGEFLTPQLRSALQRLIEATATVPYVPCDLYHVEYGRPRCYKTRECSVCTCGGNKLKCEY